MFLVVTLLQLVLGRGEASLLSFEEEEEVATPDTHSKVQVFIIKPEHVFLLLMQH